jgi:ADP-ribose pyrophosphatase YjhB (NUDIX family)
MELEIPDGDDPLRATCQDCGAVVYENPKLVVSCVIMVAGTQDGPSKLLLAERAIEPRAGYWGIPQGYMELEETTRQAICREVREESGVLIAEN